MTPQPRKHNPQHQPLTTSLRKICRDYPAGAGIFNELLQNADDAGASTVRFVLDTTFHPDSPVLVDGLSEYQGPALLAYNNAVFSEKDFASLTSLGDSKKLEDKAATGKFGLGFSSTFNWTDCPSIVSGSTLLFLDPHHSWSRDFDPPGGPEYDFVTNSEDLSMINQLRCFSLINQEWDHPFDGTIIRIPLRTTSRAAKSKICSKSTTPEDIQRSMDSFADEIGSEGLLFLKSVQKIVLEVDRERLNLVEITNRSDLSEPKRRLKEAINELMNNKVCKDGSLYHEVHLTHWKPDSEVTKIFGVLNLVATFINETPLERWAASEKMFPWVAIAAPLKQIDNGYKSGRLFSTLPLPIFTGLPVNIHGLFSMSSDRCRLHGLEQNGTQDHRPGNWNQFLFEHMIPRAWSELLLNLAHSHQDESHFHLWPTNTSSPQELWYRICPAMVAAIVQKSLAVWFTEAGYVPLQEGLLLPDKTSLANIQMLREAKVPIISVAKYLFIEACGLMEDRILSPRTLYKHLKHAKSIKNLSEQSRLLLLEFLLPEIHLAELATFEIFPFQDRSFRSLELPRVFLHRNDSEAMLFERQQTITIDTNRLAKQTAQLCHDQVKDGSCIMRYRTAEDLKDYYLEHIADGLDDILVLDDKKMPILDKIWKWILEYGEGQLSLETLGSLWLIPLRGGAVRKLVPLDVTNFATWFGLGQSKNTAIQVFVLDPDHGPKILAEDVLSKEVYRHLLITAENEPSLCLRDGQKFMNFLDFLTQSHSILHGPSETVTDLVLHTLRQLYSATSPVVTDLACQKFRSLCLFKAVHWPRDTANLSVRTMKTSLTGDLNFVGLRKLMPIPPDSKTVFLNATEEHEKTLLTSLGRIECLNEVQTLESLVIPALQSDRYDIFNSKLRLEVVNLLFENYHRLSSSAQNCVSTCPVVPIRLQKEQDTSLFGPPLDMLDPRNLQLANLYFEDELRYPDERFCTRFRDVLATCGMIQFLNERLVLNRVRTYHERGCEIKAVASRVKNLLELQFHQSKTQSVGFADILRHKDWLPGLASDGSEPLTNATRCRDICDGPVVGHVWSILQFEVERSWKAILGWHNIIDVDVLMTQVMRAILVPDLDSVEKTLAYLDRHHSMDSYASRLLDLDFIRTNAGELVSPTSACRGGADKLGPYLHVVDPRFWDGHGRLMKLAEVPELPSREQLENVQSALELKQPLNEEDLDVATELAHIWSDRFHESVDGLKLPTTKGVLVDIVDMSFDDMPWVSDETQNTLHRKVSRAIAENLKVPMLSELVRNGTLGIADPDDDEFHQMEEVTDGIRDTLGRYTRESTFHEYIANSDDCNSASEVNFLLDKRTYNKGSLLTKELEALQGPSLLIHNDGVFSEADFDGLKHVGRGSKRDDPTTIGKFGRGSQTMYHWTDVPMILSGKYILILDPLRKHLPYNYRQRQRKPGIKIEYAKLMSSCSDQLAPFESHWNFDSSQSYYHGTIFRFPLRRNGKQSELLEALHSPDISTVREIFHSSLDEARLALLFLRNIKSIDFGVTYGGTSGWSVRRGNWPAKSSFSDWANVVVEKHNDLGEVECITERWWRAIVDVSDAPADLQHRHKRTMKYVECGIAALVAQQEERVKSPLRPLKSKFFNCLPLKFQSTLPVQTHGTFLLSGDRQNIAIEETSQDAGSDWNKWLLEKSLPDLYLHFLGDLGRRIDSDVFQYFPVAGNNTSDPLSDCIRTSFWNMMGSSTCPIFPTTRTFGDSGFQSQSRNSRTPPKLLTFGQSVFDVLEEQKFDVLRTLLQRFCKDLVRPPLQLRKHIQSIPGVKLLTPAVVRLSLKSATPEDIERAIQLDKDFLGNLLSLITPKDTKEFIDLHKCPVLPLATGKVGTLSVLRLNGKVPTMYFSANAESEDIFSFASSIFCTRKGNTTFVKEVVKSGLLNVKDLKKTDISTILTYRTSLIPSSEAWLYRFWTYMNAPVHTPAGNSEPNSLNLDHFEGFPLILLRNHDGTANVGSLHYFLKEPVVVQSTIRGHMDLFADFPLLSVADSKTLPRKYCDVEKSLHDSLALERFLKSVSILASRKDKGFTEYAKTRLKPKSIETMQQILGKAFREHGRTLSKFAKLFPVWPSVSAERGHLTAEEAVVAQTPAFVVPWIKNYDRFTSSEYHIQTNVVEDTCMIEQYVLPKLPKLLEVHNKSSYFKLIAAMARGPFAMKDKSKRFRFTEMLKRYRLAPRQDGSLCHARDLFDHSDGIFFAAFRYDNVKRFLALETRPQLTFWHEVGLRRRVSGKYQGEDYLACLNTLEDRLSRVHDQHLATDTNLILNPLCTNSGSLCEVVGSVWHTITRLQVFPVRQELSNEPVHRRLSMELLASQNSTLCLEKIVRYEFAAVCWSRIPFALQEPTSQSSLNCGTNGKPSCSMVWEHLSYLAQLAQWIGETDIEGFLADLDQTYDYLRSDLQGSKDTFRSPTAAIWLNLDSLTSNTISLDTFKSSWTTLENLLLDTLCDAPPLMAVQPYLGGFSTLLKELGCRSIVYPQVDFQLSSQSSTASAKVGKLWQQEILTDVTFRTEEREIMAHKIILASQSLYCLTQFTGPWGLISQINGAKEVINLEDMNYATLQILIGFCYEEHQDWAAKYQVTGDEDPLTVADKLDVLLDVLTAADRWRMSDLHEYAQNQLMIGIKFFVRPDNVAIIRLIADEANAIQLRNYCDEFSILNAESVLLATAENN